MQSIRQMLSRIALEGFASSLVVYFESFRGLTLDSMFGWLFLIRGGVFVVMVPVFIVERAAMNTGTFFWKDFRGGKPSWVYPTILILSVIFVVHFVLFLVLSHAASPAIVNNDYVLKHHGHIRKFLTEGEYRSLKGHEQRIFPTGWLIAYAVAAIYWWFPNSSKRTVSFDL